MPGFHSLLSPSGASRWMKCNPSARFESQFPDQDSVYAKEGTLAHSLAELFILRMLGRIQLKPYQKALAKIIAHDLYQPEMKAYCDNYATFIIEKYNGYKGAILFPEMTVDLSMYIPEGKGTIDVPIVSGHILDITDFKYGKGVPVNAFENTQMLCYALGAYEEFSLIYDIDTIKMTICQPRLDSISEWQIGIGELMAWAETQLRPNAERAWKGEGEYMPGEHCKFCRGRIRCKAIADYMHEATIEAFAHIPREIDEKKPFVDGEPFRKTTPDKNLISDQEIVLILTRAKTIQSWLESVSEYALRQALENGKKWPDMKLVEGRSNRIYSNEEKVKKALRDAGYKDLQILEPETLLGITKLTAEMGTADFNRLVDPFLIKPKGSPTLVPQSDKRTELDSTANAIECFAKIDLENDIL